VAQLQSLRFKREATEQELLANIRSTHENLVSAISRQADTKLNAQAAANVLSSYERLFIAGKRSWLDVMNAAGICQMPILRWPTTKPNNWGCVTGLTCMQPNTHG
jgi:hypothetical protein